MWCSDYVDCERGVLVQRIGSIVLDGSLEYTKNDATENNDNYLYYYWCPSLLKGHDDTDKILCDKFITKIGSYQINNTNSIEYAGIATSGIKAIYINLGYLMEENTTEEFKRVISENPLTVQYILEEPIETPLTASEIESYKALRSNYKVTSVMNDCECYESITYNADTETWINNKIEARVASVLASLAL